MRARQNIGGADRLSGNSIVAYVLSRLKDKIIIYIYYKREKDINNLYLTLKNILDKLILIYTNSNRLKNARRSLSKLVIRDRSFRFFIINFIRFSRTIKFNN